MNSPQTSQSAAGIARKRAVNLTLNTGLVAEAKLLSPNLSATVESLLEGFVAREREARLNRHDAASTTCATSCRGAPKTAASSASPPMTRC